MKALYYSSYDRLEVTDVPIPHLEDGEVLVRVSECGICGSELESFRTRSARRVPPLVMGHEFCGYIEKTGTCRNWIEGTPVIAHALIHCGACVACRRGDTNVCAKRHVFGMHRFGGFGEYVAVPGHVLTPWPPGLPASTAIFAEPLANGINAMSQGSSNRKSRVVVIGAGPIGLMCVFVAKHLYKSSVIVSDFSPERLNAARALGADLTVNAQQTNLAKEMQMFWDGYQAELVIDAVGNEITKCISIELLEPGGTAVWLGLQEDLIRLNSSRLTVYQQSVCGSYSGSFRDFEQAVQILASGAIDTSWARTYVLDDGEAAFRDMLLGAGKNIKGILRLAK